MIANSVVCPAGLTLFESPMTHTHTHTHRANTSYSWRSHDNAGDWDAAALVAVALDALGLPTAATGLGGLDDALDGRDGCGAGSVRHLVLGCSIVVWVWVVLITLSVHWLVEWRKSRELLDGAKKGGMMSVDGRLDANVCVWWGKWIESA